MWFGVVWCGVVWCGVAWRDVVWCGVVWCGVVWCGVVCCGVVWYGVVWCGVVWRGVVTLWWYGSNGGMKRMCFGEDGFGNNDDSIGDQADHDTQLNNEQKPSLPPPTTGN